MLPFVRRLVGHFSGCSLDQLKDLVTEATERLKEVQLHLEPVANRPGIVARHWGHIAAAVAWVERRYGPRNAGLGIWFEDATTRPARNMPALSLTIVVACDGGTGPEYCLSASARAATACTQLLLLLAVVVFRLHTVCTPSRTGCRCCSPLRWVQLAFSVALSGGYAALVPLGDASDTAAAVAAVASASAWALSLLCVLAEWSAMRRSGRSLRLWWLLSASVAMVGIPGIVASERSLLNLARALLTAATLAVGTVAFFEPATPSERAYRPSATAAAPLLPTRAASEDESAPRHREATASFASGLFFW